MARGGAGVVETPSGEKVLVPGALEGEEVQVRLGKRRAGVTEGVLLRVEQPSPHRRVPPCELAAVCGGCPWMALTDAGQRRAKQALLDRISSRYGLPAELRFGAPLEYRRRARLAWRASKREGGAPQMGYRRERSHRLVDVDRCLVLQPELARLWDLLRESALPLAGSGEIRLYRHGDGAVAWLSTGEPQPPELYQALRERVVPLPGVAGVALDAQGSVAIFGEVTERYLGADGQWLNGPAAGFSQAHDPLSLELAREVGEAVRGGRSASSPGPRVLELYAGHGFLTVNAAPGCARYTAVELAPDAAEALRGNVTTRFLDVRVVASDAAAQCAAGLDHCDVLLLDPPRTGARDVVSAVASARRGPNRVVYVSCDLATLERDLDALCANGRYAARRLKGFDLFPQTARLEVLAVLERVQQA